MRYCHIDTEITGKIQKKCLGLFYNFPITGFTKMHCKREPKRYEPFPYFVTAAGTSF